MKEFVLSVGGSVNHWKELFCYWLMEAASCDQVQQVTAEECVQYIWEVIIFKTLATQFLLWLNSANSVQSQFVQLSEKESRMCGCSMSLKDPSYTEFLLQFNCTNSVQIQFAQLSWSKNSFCTLKPQGKLECVEVLQHF